MEICDVIWKHCGSKNQVTYNGSAFFSSLRFGTDGRMRCVTKSNYDKKLKLEMKHKRFYILVQMTKVQVMGTVTLLMSRHMVGMKIYSFYLEYVIPIIIITG